MSFKNLFASVTGSWLDCEGFDAKVIFERVRIITKKYIRAKKEYCTTEIMQRYVLSYKIIKDEGKPYLKQSC